MIIFLAQPIIVSFVALLFLLMLLELPILRIIKHEPITYYCGQNELSHTGLGGVLPVTYILPTFLPPTNIGDFLQSIIIIIIIIIVSHNWY